MWKSAIARAKRIGDHGRKSVPVVKVESNYHFGNLHQFSENALRSNDDDSDDDAVIATKTATKTTSIESVSVVVDDNQIMVSAGLEEDVAFACAPDRKSSKRKGSAGKKAAVDARKKLSKARKSMQ